MAGAVEDLIQGVQAIRTQDDEATLMENIQQAAALMRQTITELNIAVTQINTNLLVIEQAVQNFREPEVTTLADFKASRENIKMDSATKHDMIIITGGKLVQNTKQRGSPEDDKFTYYHQALSQKQLKKKCYFEVEVKGTVAIAVAYRNITTSDTPLFGSGLNSWAFRLDKRGVFYNHNKQEELISPTHPSKVEVRLDQGTGGRQGVLQLISRDPAVTYKVKTKFNGPLYAGVWFHSAEDGWCQFI